jgi:hypothetical protein
MREDMFKGILSASAIALSVAAVPAYAGCTEANAVGTWKLYSANATGSSVAWAKCTLIVQAGGKIKGGSSCSNAAGQSSPAVGLVHLTSGPACTFNGNITYTANGAVSTVTEATMVENKQSVFGVGTFSGGAFIFNMAKIR